MNILILGQKSIYESCVVSFLQEKTKGKFADLKIRGIVSDTRDVKGTEEVEFLDIHVSFSQIEDFIIKNEIDCLISIQFPRILPKNIFRLVNDKAFNLHNAKLPDYRGHNSLTYEILNGDNEHTMTIHWMVEEVDRGFTALTQSFPIFSFDTAYSLYKKCLQNAPQLFNEFMALLERGAVPKIPITGKGNFYSIHLCKEIDNKTSPEEKERVSRAFYFPGKEPAYIKSGTQKVYLLPMESNLL